MSWWDHYLAPGDLRQRQQSQPSQPSSQLEDERPRVVVLKPRLSPTDRARRQNGLLYGGIAFTILSAFVTRRAIGRKIAQNLGNPSATSTASSSPEPKTDASLDAIQALGYATLNVFSTGMLGIGAAMTYFDIAEVEDMRDMIRRQEGYSDESEANKEIEGWIAEVLARKDGQGKMRDSVVAEIERRRKEADGGKR